MTSDTNTYTTLVKVFREQARKEAEEIHQYLIDLSKQQQFDGGNITFSEAVNYCKNFSRLGSVTGTNLADELKNHEIKVCPSTFGSLSLVGLESFRSNCSRVGSELCCAG
jgi:hypothetical protein